MPISLNRYAHCINDPITFVDPSGLQYCAVMLTDGGGGKTTDVNQVVSQMAQEALNNYKNGSIKKLADTVHYMQDNRNKLSAENLTLLTETEAAIKNQRDTQMSLKGTKKERPAVREVSDYLAEMCSKITGNSFSPTYLTEDGTSYSSSIIKKVGSDSIKKGDHNNSEKIPVSYISDAAKQMYLQQWDYPDDGRSGHYGIVSCTWLIDGVVKSFYVDKNQLNKVSTISTEMHRLTLKNTNRYLGQALRELIDIRDEALIPKGVVVFNKEGESYPHVGLSVGEIITYDLIYVEQAVIQASSGTTFENKKNYGKGVVVTDMSTGKVYFEGPNGLVEGETSLFLYGYLPLVDYPKNSD